MTTVQPEIVVQTDHSQARLWKKVFLDCESHILAEVELEQEEVKMMGKTFTPSRKTSYQGDPGVSYRYAGKTRPALSWTPYVLAIKNKAEEITNQEYDFGLVNYYPDGKSKLGWHSDDERDLTPNSTIASVSFGAKRIFQVRTRPTQKGGKPGPIINIPLECGDLLTMEGNFQKEFKHSVPARAKVTEPRVNLTFRHLKI